MNKTEYEEYLMLSSIPLRELGSDLSPIGTGSGCLTDYKGKRILLTVKHVTGNRLETTGKQGDWAAEVEYDPTRGEGEEMLLRMGSMNFLHKFNIINNEKPEDLDFSYVEVPLDFKSLLQDIDKERNIVLKTIHRIMCPISFRQPVKGELFGFAGQINVNLDGRFLTGELKAYTNIEYREETLSGYYVFKLPCDHPGHDYFEGCSGAPIIDKNGIAVGLVCGGDISTNSIYGIAFKEHYLLPLGL